MVRHVDLSMRQCWDLAGCQQSGPPDGWAVLGGRPAKQPLAASLAFFFSMLRHPQPGFQKSVASLCAGLFTHATSQLASNRLHCYAEALVTLPPILWQPSFFEISSNPNSLALRISHAAQPSALHTVVPRDKEHPACYCHLYRRAAHTFCYACRCRVATCASHAEKSATCPRALTGLQWRRHLSQMLATRLVAGR